MILSLRDQLNLRLEWGFFLNGVAPSLHTAVAVHRWKNIWSESSKLVFFRTEFSSRISICRDFISSLRWHFCRPSSCRPLREMGREAVLVVSKAPHTPALEGKERRSRVLPPQPRAQWRLPAPGAHLGDQGQWPPREEWGGLWEVEGRREGECQEPELEMGPQELPLKK